MKPVTMSEPLNHSKTAMFVLCGNPMVFFLVEQNQSNWQYCV